MSIETAEASLRLTAMDGPPRNLGKGVTNLRLPRDVYRVESKHPVDVRIVGKPTNDVGIASGDLKDPPPKPRPQIIGETDEASASFQSFMKRFNAFFAGTPAMAVAPKTGGGRRSRGNLSQPRARASLRPRASNAPVK